MFHHVTTPIFFFVLLVTSGSYNFLEAKPCTTKDLSVFTTVSGQVSNCQQASKLNFPVPPRSSLSKTQEKTLCKARACLEMIGAMDDLDVPTCEILYDERNMTLQTSLDRFVSSCDLTTPAPSPMKKRRHSLEDSSASAAASHRRYTNDANVGRFSSLSVLGLVALYFVVDFLL